MLNTEGVTFLGSLGGAISLGLEIEVPDQRGLSKVRTLVVGHEVNVDFILVGSILGFVLLDATFYNHVHVLVYISFPVDCLAGFVLYHFGVLVNSASFFYFIRYVHLFKMTKNLLKFSI